MAIKPSRKQTNKYSLSHLSIKKLTIMGFVLVACPLFLALIYAANQSQQISKQGTQAIFSVSTLISTNKQLNHSLVRAERYASQYMVLKDVELLDNFTVEQFKLTDIINSQLHQFNDKALSQLANTLLTIVEEINSQLSHVDSGQFNLASLQATFKKLNQLHTQIEQRADQLIITKANSLEHSAKEVNQLVIKSLLIIPISLIIAAVFIYLISAPLKKLTQNIKQLTQGNFEQKITSSGSPEVTEIADALDIMRTRLHALELQKSSFIRHISHELKTPLAAIREGTELLHDNSVGQLNSGQQEICQILKHSVNRLQRLIEDLLDFNIVLDSTSLQDSEVINLHTLTTLVLNERKLDIQRKKLTITCPNNTIAIACNQKQLSVILDNIISNAIKYSPLAGVITIDAKLIKHQAMITITDHGPGIESAKLPQIFDAFYQGSPPKHSQDKGSGLGLTIVKELIMRLNGTINIVNKPTKPHQKNHGLKVTITLPRAFYQESSHV